MKKLILSLALCGVLIAAGCSGDSAEQLPEASATDTKPPEAIDLKDTERPEDETAPPDKGLPSKSDSTAKTDETASPAIQRAQDTAPAPTAAYTGSTGSGAFVGSSNNSSTESATNSSSPDSAEGNANSESDAPADPNAGKTWHDAIYEDVWVVDVPAGTREEPVYATKEISVCNTCSADITGNTIHTKEHTLAGEGGSYRSEVVQVQTGTKTVSVPEQGHWESRLVREAGYY